MRDGVSGPQAGLQSIARISLTLLLAVLLSACAGGPTLPGFQSPEATPTQPASPLETPTALPKPTDTPAPTPTHTPMPTPLPLPSSAYYALWVDTLSPDVPGGPQGTLWLADPLDIGRRQAIVHFDDQEIYHAAVAPDGRRVAVTAASWRAPERPLWIVDISAGDLTQLLPNADQIEWGRDGHVLAYTVNEGPAGTALHVVNVTTRESHRLTSVEAEEALNLLGWSANNQEVYYIPSPLQGTSEHYLWAADPDTRATRQVVSLGDQVGWPFLSPDGTKLLYGYGSPEGLLLLDLTGGMTKHVQPPGQGFVTWSSDSKALLVFGIQDNTLVLRSLDVATQQSTNMASFQGMPLSDWQLLALSPDRDWLAAYHHYTGLYWMHLPAGVVVPVPTQGRIIFLGWVPRPPEQ